MVLTTCVVGSVATAAFVILAGQALNPLHHHDPNNEQTILAEYSNADMVLLRKILHYAYPIVVLFFYLFVFTFRSIYTSSKNHDPGRVSTQLGPGGKLLPPSARRTSGTEAKSVILDFSRPRKVLFDSLSLLLAFTFVANGANVVIHAIVKRDEGWWCGKSYVFYVIGSFFVFSLLVLSLFDTKPSPTHAHLSTWLLALVLELILVAAALQLYTKQHREPHADGGHWAGKSYEGHLRYGMTKWELVEIFVDFTRVFCLIALSSFYVAFVVARNIQARKVKAAAANGSPDELTGLLSEPRLEEDTSTDIEAEAVRTDGQVPVEQDNTDSSLPEEASDKVQDHGPVATNGSALTISRPSEGDADETTQVLEASTNLNGSLHRRVKNYGTTTDTEQPSPPTTKRPSQGASNEPAGWERPKTVPSRSWWEYIKGYSVLFPYLWPSGARRLQVLVVICIIFMIIQRGLNFLVPNQVGHITNLLAGQEGQEGSKKMPWGAISMLIVYRFLQGNNGLIGAVRSILWIPVGQYAYRELSCASFEHVHSLSLDFHLGKKTGEVCSALGKGASINGFLETVTFQLVPMLVDLAVAIGYFLVKFDSYFALVLSIVTFSYIYITVRMAQWRGDYRRQMTDADREEDAVKNDSMVSYETVKYFNAEPWEFERYRSAVNKYLNAEYLVNTSLNYMNLVQNAIFMLGLLFTSFILAWQITTGQQKVGQFTTLLVYMAQLQQPLNFFGTFYRSIQSAMINSERLLELFKEQPTVVDNPSAVALPSCEGTIDFKDVKFAYDERKPALDGLTFHCAPGTTTALVGESGGGKSTVFRLLFRFYNQESGSIQVDGHDVQEVTMDSFRKHMGVVPQDTVLFNDTVMYNLKYANQNATDEEVFEACRAASIHDKILAMPDGYNTRVGERGLRLSGGEKQRVAIARTIIKNPRIILLDEATAALDTETEQHIQEAFDLLGHGRTMLVIAHRLSTITLADQILVLHQGRIHESGTHEELLAHKGRYASMWKKQVRAQKAAEEAKALKDRADRLRKEAGEGEGSASQSEDEAERIRHQQVGSAIEAEHDGKPTGHP